MHDGDTSLSGDPNLTDECQQGHLRWPHNALRFLGVVCLLSAGGGLFLSALSVGFVATQAASAPSPIVFWIAYVVMSLVCVACCVLLGFYGVHFIRLHHAKVTSFVSFVTLEVVYVFLVPMAAMVAMMGPLRGFGESVMGAYGVANVGLAAQIYTLVPLWGPFLALWALRTIESAPGTLPSTNLQWSAGPDELLCGVIRFVVVFCLLMVLFGDAQEIWKSGTLPSDSLIWVPLVLSVIDSVQAQRARRKRRQEKCKRLGQERLKSGKCPRCEYDLTGLPEPRCPECAAEFDPAEIDV